MLIAPDNLFYATPEVDRMAFHRQNGQWIEGVKHSDQARFILLHDTRNLFRIEGGSHTPSFIRVEQLPVECAMLPWAYLGRCGDEDLFVIDATGADEQKVLSSLGGGFAFEDLRRAGPLSDKTRAAQMAYGRALMFWHSRHLYCGACGSKTESRDAGHVRRCVNPQCNLDHFPRTDPAVIMLVHDDEKCLLAHNNRLKPGMYSTLAGFVEPGETLEQAVRREVMEEAGVKVGEVTYAGSQPWPFPTSLMLGFYGRAESYEISLEDDELLDAQWFTHDDLRNFSSVGRSLPSKDSIARNLIENWLKE